MQNSMQASFALDVEMARGLPPRMMEAFNVIESAISVLCSVSVSLSCGTVALSYCVLWFPYAFLSLPFLAFLCTCVMRCVVVRVRQSDYVI